MTSIGKIIRMKRLIDEKTNSCIICALDHGMTSPQVLSGLIDIRERTREAIAGGARVFMLGRGMATRVARDFLPDTSLALMLTSSAACRPEGAVVTPIGSVEEALMLGADAVVVYVALAESNEAEMITYASKIGEECLRLGMPYIAEAEFPNAYSNLVDMKKHYGFDYLLRNARLCTELGADIVKVNWSGDEESFSRIVKACLSPVVLAGGSQLPDKELLERFEQAVHAGAIGCSVGRNIFQHRNPEAITHAICRVMRDKWPAKQALEELSEFISHNN